MRKIVTMLLTFSALISLLSCEAAGSNIDGATAKTQVSYVGCRDAEDALLVGSQVLKSDAGGLQSMILDGRCTIIEENTPGTVEKSLIFGDLVCFRPQGRSFCSYLFEGVLRKD